MPRRPPVIAIVDDDLSVCRALKRLVRAAGFEAQTFNCGQDLLNALSNPPHFRPDCVVLDMHMPGMTGLELQQHLAGSTLPVVFITAHDDAALRAEVLKAGAVALLRKPFDDALFIETLQAALQSPPYPG